MSSGPESRSRQHDPTSALERPCPKCSLRRDWLIGIDPRASETEAGFAMGPVAQFYTKTGRCPASKSKFSLSPDPAPPTKAAECRNIRLTSQLSWATQFLLRKLSIQCSLILKFGSLSSCSLLPQDAYSLFIRLLIPFALERQLASGTFYPSQLGRIAGFAASDGSCRPSHRRLLATSPQSPRLTGLRVRTDMPGTTSVPLGLQASSPGWPEAPTAAAGLFSQ
jgi:hypothetical protein